MLKEVQMNQVWIQEGEEEFEKSDGVDGATRDWKKEKVKQTELSPLMLCHAEGSCLRSETHTSQCSHEPNQTAEGGGEERPAG